MSGALIAMSGGVDSSVAAYLTKARGFDCVGATMKLFDNNVIDADINNDKACCSFEDAQDAREVARRLDIPYYVFNFANEFKSFVIDEFVSAYKKGETPNPCINCNRFMKFEKLLLRAKQLDMEYLVTGHYARIERNNSSGRFLLKKGLDESKDQSYFLCLTTREQLQHSLFPLGELRKSEVREIAREQGFANAKKRESQDICFVPNGDYAEFIRDYAKEEFPKGRFLDLSGKVLGENNGIIHYTVGQRRGLGLSASTPLYVCELCADDNSVIVGSEENLYSKTLIARDINLIAVEKFNSPVKLNAKIRYKHQEQPAVVWQTGDDELRVEFDQPQRAITKGQTVALYDGDVVVGGGIIAEVARN